MMVAAKMMHPGNLGIVPGSRAIRKQPHYFLFADHPGVIAWWLESNAQVRSLQNGSAFIRSDPA
jgi:hypothetical protein